MRLNRRQSKDRMRKSAGPATSAQLVAAAAEVFAAAGFRGATVRDICRQAGANVAAVNYHFGGKEGLYEEVLRCGLRQALNLFPANRGTAGGAPVEQRLRGFIRSFLERFLATGPDACHGRLLMREMVDPTPALDAVVAKEIRTWMEHLGGMVAEVLGDGATASQVQLCTASVVGQVVFYHHCRPVIPRAFPGLEGVLGDVEALSGHILRFSMAGLRQEARQEKPAAADATLRRTTARRRDSRMKQASDSEPIT
jgi:AcrR family transcriptional regulator